MRIKRGISVVVIACLIAGNLSVITPASAGKASTIKLNCTKAAVSVTHEKQLTLKKLSKKQKKNVRWSSSDESVATVSGKGLVQTWKPGKASIKAKYKNKTYTCKLTVTGPADGKFYLPLTSSDATSYTTATWIYKDSWFTESSTIYERELARLSATLCWASTPARDKSDEEQSFYLRRCLTALGFGDFYVNDDYKKKPDKMTFGVAYALKTVKKGKKRYTLIAVVPRSSGYGSEWVSNMTLGYGPVDHEGFTRAKEILLEGLTKYLSDQSVKGDIKLWFAGHSRGAGTCALAEAYLADHPESLPDEISLQREDIYGYNLSTIHAAAFSSQEDRDHMQKDYPFIHNIELPYDIFKELIPSYYGFDRYGVTHGLYYTPDDEKKALKILEKTDPALYSTYSRHIPSEHGVAELMSAFVSTMTEKIPSRKIYVDEWQKKMDGMRDVPDLLPVFMPIFIDMKTAQADVYAATIQHYSQVMYCFLSIDLHGVA
ncbi:MAG: Ig-like domain-containing protein [Eubacterium sp.]|nr:Ig-like domain-containing protein [Eubacterium sp.]